MSDQPKDQSEGREKNAAASAPPGVSNVSPQDYPSAGRDDAIERTGRTEEVAGEGRSFDSKTGNPAPKQGAGDASAPSSTSEGLMGPQGDPAEGKP
jgi:hypothetical protein